MAANIPTKSGKLHIRHVRIISCWVFDNVEPFTRFRIIYGCYREDRPDGDTWKGAVVMWGGLSRENAHFCAHRARKDAQQEQHRNARACSVGTYGNRIHKREPWRGEAKPLFSLDNGGVEVMACVSSSYLTGTIYHYFFSRCLANVKGTRTISHRPRSVTVAIDWSASSRFDLWDIFGLLVAFTNFRRGRVYAYSRKQ